MDAVAEAEAYLAAIEPDRRRDEAAALDRIFREVTGFAPKLWSGRMIGYGQYHYTYNSGHSGTSLATGFAIAPRQITIYVLPGYTPFPEIMARIGKHRKGKSCLYLTRLESVDDEALCDLIRAGLEDLGKRWRIEPS